VTTPQPPGVLARKTKHAKAYVIGFVVLVLALLAGGVFLSWDRSGGGNWKLPNAPSTMLSEQEQRDLLDEFRELVEQMQKTQIVTKIEEPAYNGVSTTGRIWVSPSAWYGATFDQKRSMCYVLAKYCAAMIASRHLDCEIIDDHTGRRLARYTDDGFSME
jgi:hypothetical protein